MSGWPIYVISLRTEFWTTLERQARAIGLSATRWAATDGKTIDLAAWIREGLYEPPADPSARTMTRGEIGCAHSHQRVWAHIVAAGFDGALVLEDDADLPDDLPQWVDRAKQHRDAWDILYLGYTPWARSTPVEQAPGFVVPDLTGGWHVTHAYMVTAAGAGKLLQGARPVRLPVDVQISRLTLSGVRAWQSAEPVVGVRQDTYSSTQGIS